jgi:glycosyltransferase involved in cell wall biosynthesis
MRITFVLPTVNLSGGIRVAAIYAKALEQKGHTVRLISPPKQSASAADKLKALLKGKGWLAAPLPSPSHLDGTGLDHRVIDQCRPVTDDDVPDGEVVIATWWETAEWVAALSPSKGAKVYLIQHHELFAHLPLARCRDTYRLPMHKIVVARWLKDVMQAEYGDSVVDLVPNSVDKAQFFAPVRGKQPVPTVGCMYSSHAFKGLDATLEAIRIVAKQVPNLRLIAFGVGAPSPEFEFPDFTEQVSSPRQDELRDLYARCDVWVTASRSEGFNLPALEAMACRTPVVSTRTGWPEEAVVTGKNGVLVDVDDVAALARGIEWVLLRSEDEWRELSANACATVAASSWQRSAEMFEEALRHACRRAVRGEIAGRSYAAAVC